MDYFKNWLKNKTKSPVKPPQKRRIASGPMNRRSSTDLSALGRVGPAHADQIRKIPTVPKGQNIIAGGGAKRNHRERIPPQKAT